MYVSFDDIVTSIINAFNKHVDLAVHFASSSAQLVSPSKPPDCISSVSSSPTFSSSQTSCCTSSYPFSSSLSSASSSSVPSSTSFFQSTFSPSSIICSSSASSSHLGDLQIDRFLVGIGGIAGSGKSLLAQHLAKKINSIFAEELRKANIKETCEICTIVQLDGFHYPLDVLRRWPNFEEAIARRGAEWTFDVEEFGKTLKKLSEKSDEDIYVPTFDHKLKDPNNKGNLVRKNHRIILVEGLYVLLNKPPWNVLVTPLLHFKIYIDVPMTISEDRVCRRHVESQICENYAQSKLQWERNDKQNAALILLNFDRSKLDLVVCGTIPLPV